ncbi:MAG: nucleoside deaminase [bacterium]
MDDSQKLMELAIAKAQEGIARGQTPFGCAISLQGEIVAVTHNTVFDSTDITAHAEINALREACRKTGEILLLGAIVASTCEPCPMCAAAWTATIKMTCLQQLK